MDRVEAKRNPGILFLNLLILSILISTAPKTGLYLYVIIFAISSFINKRSIFHSFKKSPFLVMLLLATAISHMLTSRSWSSGFAEGMRFTLLIAFSFLFIETADSTELASSLGNILSAFIGKRAWRLSSMIMVTLSIIPMILRVATEMYNARLSRNQSFVRHPIKSLAEYSTSLFEHLLKRSEEFYEALIARGFKPDMRRSAPPILPFDIISFIGVVSICIVVMISRK